MEIDEHLKYTLYVLLHIANLQNCVLTHSPACNSTLAHAPVSPWSRAARQTTSCERRGSRRSRRRKAAAAAAAKGGFGRRCKIYLCMHCFYNERRTFFRSSQEERHGKARLLLHGSEEEKRQSHAWYTVVPLFCISQYRSCPELSSFRHTLAVEIDVKCSQCILGIVIVFIGLVLVSSRYRSLKSCISCRSHRSCCCRIRHIKPMYLQHTPVSSPFPNNTPQPPPWQNRG